MLNELKQKVLKEIEQAKGLSDIDKIYNKYIGKRGELTIFLRSLKDLPKEERAEKGKQANILKRELVEIISKKEDKFSKSRDRKKGLEKEWIDVTVPGQLPVEGHLHPITLVQRQIQDIFQSMGFSVVYGPEIETEHYNFDALNIPKDHPARDMFDTFWIKGLKYLLRTHTSPMQARYMEKNNPPLRIIVPGRCFRHEATDASHEAQFNQIEGLMVGNDISLADLKGILDGFMKRFYGKDVKLRWQPSYFPFVEPGLELMIGCTVCGGKGCSTCGQSGWMELIPCGMVHPNVFKAVGYNQKKWKGFAFGMGLDRVVMMKYRIDDIRLLHNGDLRFIRQF
ncbi:phenylalanine--tRNA ligase subunit alpha [Patescibacteria group bacterium]